MRLTAFWRPMRAECGETYAESFARVYVIAELGDVPSEALEQGRPDVQIGQVLVQQQHLGRQLMLLSGQGHSELHGLCWTLAAGRFR